MTTDAGRNEILLRREGERGGLIFHPSDATFVHLDAEGFDTAVDTLHRGNPPADEAARAFADALRAELPPISGPTRLLELPAAPGRELSHLFAMPTLMDFQITERCPMECPQCYAAASPTGRHAAWADARHAFTAMREAGVCQVAIGGGEPLTHPHLPEMLALVRDLGMVPNLTTTGIGMTASQRAALAHHCGAVALSLEGVGHRFGTRRRQGFTAFTDTVAALLDGGINLVFQITLSAGNIEELPEIVEYLTSVAPLYGVIFLAHKPAGRATGYDAPLATLPFATVYRQLAEAMRVLHPHTRVGFDCCLTPLVAALEADLGFPPDTILEGCSGARGSLGLTPNLEVVPCTFLPHQSLGNLRTHSLHEIWHGSAAAAFRQRLLAGAKTACRGECGVRHVCLGGCPVWNLVGCRWQG